MHLKNVFNKEIYAMSQTNQLINHNITTIHRSADNKATLPCTCKEINKL